MARFRFKIWPFLVIIVGLVFFGLWFRHPGPPPAGRDSEKTQLRSIVSPAKNAPSGLWRRPTRPRPDLAPQLSPEQAQQIRELEAIGYLDGTQEPTKEILVTIHDSDRVYAGLNLYSSGHAAEAILRDMQGKELHRWGYPFQRIWPTRPIPPRKDYWRRVHLFENGDLIAIYEGWGIVKVDKDSQLIWANPTRAHHDFQVMPGGEIYALTRRASLVPSVHRSVPIQEDFLTILDSEGEQRREVSLVKAAQESPFEKPLLSKAREVGGDIFHTNSLFVLTGKGSDQPEWLDSGNVLLSMATINTIAVLDLESEKFVKIWRGSFRFQHDPKLLDNGNMLFFDNQGQIGASAAIEFDPVTDREHWSYRGEKDGPFYSEFCGTAERLPNGNTLITESSQGRAFEVTKEKEIVWEFYNPHRAGEHQEFVASLLEVLRLPEDFPIAWTRGESSEGMVEPEMAAGKNSAAERPQ
jgi:hypothetical protein